METSSSEEERCQKPNKVQKEIEGEKEMEMKEEEETKMEGEKEIDDMTDAELDIALREKEELIAKLTAGTMIEAPKWGYDSFEDMEYYSSEPPVPDPADDEEYISNVEGWNLEYRKYKRQIIESKGFWGDSDIDWQVRYKQIHPMPLDCNLGPGSTRTFRELFLEMVHVCLDKLNQDKSEAKEPKVEFVELVRGNYRNGPRRKAYITFKAKEESDGTPVEYQAKCMETMDSMMHPMLCRRAPTV